MKKTVIALLALAGMADASTTITLGTWFTNTENSAVYTVDAVQAKDKNGAKALGLTKADGLTNSKFTFAVDVSDMLYSTTLTNDDVIQVNTITLASNSAYDSKDPGKLSITLGNNTYVSETGAEDRTGGGYGTITYKFSGENVFALGITDTLTVNITADPNVAIGVFQGQNGVDGVTNPSGFSDWQAAVKITGTQSVPEPAAATLSLLALSGLAARRRRK